MSNYFPDSAKKNIATWFDCLCLYRCECYNYKYWVRSVDPETGDPSELECEDIDECTTVDEETGDPLHNCNETENTVCKNIDYGFRVKTFSKNNSQPNILVLRT